MKDGRLILSRWLWLLLLVLNLLLILVLSFVITIKIIWLTVIGSSLLLLTAFCIALLFREALVPSRIERIGDDVIIRWDNWELRGKAVNAELREKKKLFLDIRDCKIILTPVGPMMGLASHIVRSPLRIFLPRPLAGGYYFKKEKLIKNINIENDQCKFEFPVFLFGRRKVKKWIG
jgi:hypothetical protein